MKSQRIFKALAVASVVVAFYPAFALAQDASTPVRKPQQTATPEDTGTSAQRKPQGEVYKPVNQNPEAVRKPQRTKSSPSEDGGRLTFGADGNETKKVEPPKRPPAAGADINVFKQRQAIADKAAANGAPPPRPPTVDERETNAIRMRNMALEKAIARGEAPPPTPLNANDKNMSNYVAHKQREQTMRARQNNQLRNDNLTPNTARAPK